MEGTFMFLLVIFFLLSIVEINIDPLLPFGGFLRSQNWDIL